MSGSSTHGNGDSFGNQRFSSSSHQENTYDPKRLIDYLRERLGLKNDSALAENLGMAPQRLSKVRNGVRPVTAALLIRMSEVSLYDVAELRAILGDRRAKYRISVSQFMPKDED